MLKTFIQLLGADAPVFRRYVSMAIAYGALCGLTVTVLVPVLSHLLAGDVQAASLWLAVLLAGMVVCWAWRRVVERAGVRVGVTVLQAGRQRIGVQVAGLPVGWFTPENTARLSHVVTQGMMQVAQLPAHVLTPVISGAVTPLVVMLALFALHWSLGLIALLSLPVLATALLLTARLGQRADEAYHRQFAATSARMVEFAQAQSVLRAFGGDGGGTRLLEQAIADQRQAGGRLIILSSLSAVFNAWVVQAIFGALLVACALWLQMDMDSVIAVIVALLLVIRFVDPLLDVAAYGEVLRGARGQLDAVRDILAVQPLPEPAAPLAPRDGSVELCDVRMRYAPGQPEVLRGLSLRVAPGSMTALVGASGSGKSTVLRLIARFFDVDAGSVRVGGVDVREMSSEQLAGQISQIFQDSYLFQGSIADNIRIGKPDASEAEVLEAVAQAGVSEIIARLPEGLATAVGEGGVRLSGGERQRIAIARALIKDAPILLVDEATAALDAENQAAIAEALARLRGKRTVIVIAHQLSTVAMADQIVVLDGGQVNEQGTPAQLSANGGPYAQFLAQRQAAKGWRIASPSQQAGTMS
ncbi:MULTISPECIES: ABC transporter ATP-binding protein [unclassified Janthinobacterium]|uniref:ABC transporter ATP-binding protein n=1 Tax=unclassified Janthinobacterium TaxID=2610881 RepID=UPI00161579B3|nr:MULTISPECIES: ABC transporter ATP-binding protein [unclassified Janthinobacterium]MBB5370076.1 ATP-binding cassette subfamily B protein [Janthinobacterium sp. K2C7]MBB5382882.1 ATP-binding cassette subfamily B protein [Janthinobacterium sp. K2Li3]MBB5384867.1 ATP-binding cassette subfamily B protein [Janthinobacterium sp. K2E3]